MTQTNKPAPPVMLLSQFFSVCNPDELRLIVEEYEQSLLTVLEALPIEGEHFTVVVTSLDGTPKEKTCGEEIIHDSAKARKWRDATAEKSRLSLLMHTGKFGVTKAMLSDTPDDFLKMCAARRHYLEDQHIRLQAEQRQARAQANKTQPQPPHPQEGEAQRTSEQPPLPDAPKPKRASGVPKKSISDMKTFSISNPPEPVVGKPTRQGDDSST